MDNSLKRNRFSILGALIDGRPLPTTEIKALVKESIYQTNQDLGPYLGEKALSYQEKLILDILINEKY